MTLKKLFAYMLPFLLVAGLYLAVSFFAYETNPIYWPEGLRLFLAFWGVVVFVIGFFWIALLNNDL
ncbi:MAG: hypothetical protein JW857_10410 [Bacteroidales bacterium]|nr:hypothetical protein [Bacteroidales bacterium]